MKFEKKKDGEQGYEFSELYTMTSKQKTDPTIPVILTINSRSLQVDALLDTGALHANYVSESVAERIRTELHAVPSKVNTRVFTAFNNSKISREAYQLGASFNFEDALTKETKKD